MGGIGSGGKNRTHSTIEDYERLDSFELYWYLRGDDYLPFKDAISFQNEIVYHPQTKTAEIRLGHDFIDLGLSTVPGIDGNSTRLYFLCPCCGKRVRYLYKSYNIFMCRHCLNGNYKIQQTSGLKKLTLQMAHIVENKLGYTAWKYENPDTAIQDLEYIPKPPYMRHDEYNRLISKLRELQDDYLLGLLWSIREYATNVLN